MCLIVLAWQSHPRYRLILAANRDEYYDRPSSAMHWWPDRPEVLAGRDLQAGGTWLAIARNGRFATVTNYRERLQERRHRKSRGELVTGFVAGTSAPLEFARHLPDDDYAGFCLLVGDADSLAYASNREDTARELEPGIYGLSNAALDTPWPKLTRCRDALAELLARDAVNPAALVRLLADRTPAPVSAFDDSLPVDVARAVSSPFIRTAKYGTRCTTVLTIDNDGAAFAGEWRYDLDGQAEGNDQFTFRTCAAVQSAGTR